MIDGEREIVSDRRVAQADRLAALGVSPEEGVILCSFRTEYATLRAFMSRG